MTATARAAALSALQGMEAIPVTVEVVREKQADDYLVVAPTFRGSAGRPRRGMVGIRRSEQDGWHEAGGGWASGMRKPGDVGPEDVWVNPGGWGPASPSGQAAVLGGWVADPAARKIRATDGNGRVEVDMIENGVGIFIWLGQFDMRSATVEFLDSTGQVIRRGLFLRPRR
jgi:hypothetical protein